MITQEQVNTAFKKYKRAVAEHRLVCIKLRNAQRAADVTRAERERAFSAFHHLEHQQLNEREANQ